MALEALSAARKAAQAAAAAKLAKESEKLKGAEAARAALGKEPHANPGAPLTDAMRSALKDNLEAAQNNLSLAQQGLNRAGNPFINSEVQQSAINTAQARVNAILEIFQSGVQAAKN